MENRKSMLMSGIVSIVMASSIFIFSVTASGLQADGAPQAGGSVDDVIARVGDQTITFSEINIALNSSGVVGVSVPALGSSDRDRARLVLLDRFISANLLYLDARERGVDSDPKYLRTVQRFSNAILAGLYRKHVQAGDITVTKDEIQAFRPQHLDPDVELTDGARLQIEARLRRNKLHERMATAQAGLRDGVEVTVHPEHLAPAGDSGRSDSTVLAEVDGETITWGQIGKRIIGAGKVGANESLTLTERMELQDKARRDRLESEIDLRIMAQKARNSGLNEDRVYQKRLGEYQKTLLTNLHRQRLAQRMEPTEQVLEAYYRANRSRFVVPAARKIQMVLLESRDVAADLKAKIDAGDLTMYQAARDYSTAANAKRDLGEVGWVKSGELAPALEKVVFALQPGKVGGPVESPAGWHLVTVLEAKEAKYTDFDGQKTRMLTRRAYLHDKLDAYTADLRRNQITVAVDQERLVQLAQQEADAVAALEKKAAEPGSTTQSRLRELQELVLPRM